jgi:16S rRNA (cytosine967-C5)-methyltransferase
VKPGGKLIFSVCTLSRAETTEVAVAFSASQPDFEPLVWDSVKFEERTADKFSQVTIWPQDLNGNGMFIAGWRRKKV